MRRKEGSRATTRHEKKERKLLQDPQMTTCARCCWLPARVCQHHSERAPAGQESLGGMGYLVLFFCFGCSTFVCMCISISIPSTKLWKILSTKIFFCLRSPSLFSAPTSAATEQSCRRRLPDSDHPSPPCLVLVRKKEKAEPMQMGWRVWMYCMGLYLGQHLSAQMSWVLEAHY